MANVLVWVRFVTITIIIGVLVSGCASYRKSTDEQVAAAMPGYGVARAVRLGSLIQVAYELFDQDRNNPNPGIPSQFPAGYLPLMNLQGIDKAGYNRELYGHLTRKQDEDDAYVISIRGTSDAQEWIDDAKFLLVDYPPDPSVGEVEDGFSEIFSSFTVSKPGSDQFIPLADYLSKLGIGTLTVTGHSLGSSLATLVAFDAVDKGLAKNVEILTFASPRTGNRQFVRSFESRINNSVRLVNAPDIVPKVPPWLFGYRHVWHKVSVDSRYFSKVRRSITCYHSLQTYLHILDSAIALEPQCAM